jgi:hypothetical protein
MRGKKGKRLWGAKDAVEKPNPESQPEAFP